MKVALDYLKDKLLYPFKFDLLYFILLCAIISLPAFYQKLAYPEFFSLTLVLIFYAVTYIVVFLLDLNQHATKVLKPVALISYTVLSVINFYCIYMYNRWFSYIFIREISTANMDEAREYMETYITVKVVVLVVLLFLVTIVLYKFIAKVRIRMHNVIVSLAFIPLLVAPIRIWQHPDVTDAMITGRFTWNSDYIIDLRNYLSHPHISSPKNADNPIIIIIIGESFTPSHSSLYGYEKVTNPLLQEKQKNGDLIVFSKVASPQTYTVGTFKYLLNTHQFGMEGQNRWYKSITLIEVMNVISYRTAWISNSNYNGYWTSVITGHANLCDEFILLDKDGKRHQYDGELLKCEISQKDKPLAIFYHLFGQHTEYQERYPAEYDKFKPTDYPEYNDDAAKVVAAYDNATLYNDYVVNSLIEKYKNENAVIFYFSDHGEDVYETDTNYYGHAKNTKDSYFAGRKIPFMIYLSPQYQQLHPEMTKRIRQSSERKFCTDKLIYAVMDAIGCKFADNDDVEKYSLFSHNE